VNRLASRVGVRATSVGLLIAGVTGGVYLGHGEQVQAQSVESRLVVQADAAEVDLLKERHAAHAAARAPQRKAEAEAAEKAAVEAKAAAGRARKLEKAALAKKAAEKAAADRKKAAQEAAREREEEESESGDDADDSGDSGDSGKSKPFTGRIPASCNEYSGSREIGCALVLNAGFNMRQMGCLDRLWKRESGWNHKAANRSSGAYGIPQALPGRKMASAGSDWKTNPATQIKWGLGYIKGRYGSPCGAWSHSENVGWY
jgi:hypothetical protein